MTTATSEKLNSEKSTTDKAARVVTRAEWLAARKELLAKEREFTHLRDELSRQRRELPWVKIEKQYRFEGANGGETLDDLFDGRGQLLVYHFMFGPGWKEGCPSCSFLADSFDAAALHLAQRDTTLAVVSRAPLPEIDTFKKRMGWRFKWVSSFGSDFNHDYHVTFTKEELASGAADYNFGGGMDFASEELPGASAFIRKDGQVFHTYSTYARGLDILLPTYNWLDMTAKGRDEDSLPWPMAWVRHHDRYSDGKVVGIKGITA